MAKFFKPLRDVLDVFLNLDVDEIAFQITQQKDVQEIIIELNTQSQLFDKGEDSTGRTLESIGGSYAPFTVEIKKAKGQPTNRVTLFDTGEFYTSFKIRPFNGGFIIDADPQKEDNNLFTEWGDDVVGLNQENLQIAIDLYKERLLERVNSLLNAA